MIRQNIEENFSLNEVKQRRLSVRGVTVKVQEELGGCGWGMASLGPRQRRHRCFVLFWSVEYPKGFLELRAWQHRGFLKLITKCDQLFPCSIIYPEFALISD